MKRFFTALSLAGVIIAAAKAAPFSLNSIVVERIGDGSTTLSTAAFPIAVLEYNPSGALLQTLTSEFTGSNLQTDAGSAASNGYLGFGGGRYLAVSGYNSALGTASVASQNTKVAQIIDVTTGSIISRVTFPTGGAAGTPPSPYAGNNFRSIVATGSNSFYTGGTSSGTPNTGGVWYYNGSAFTQISSTNAGQPVNIRNVDVFGGQLYFSSSSGTSLGISRIGSGLPTGSNQTAALEINMGAGASPYGFVMFDTDGNGSVDRAYIADDRATVGGGIQRWDLSTGVWSNTFSLQLNTGAGTFTNGGSGSGLRGLSGLFDTNTGTATIYGTTASGTTNNFLVGFTDDNLAAPASFTTLASAGSNYAFRGIDVVAAVPEPGTYALLALAGAGFAVSRFRRGARR